MTALDHPSVSIVLLNYNGRKFASYWQHLFSLDYPKPKYEIIFIDNGSNDGSEDLFAEMASQSPEISVTMVKLKRNCGYSKANNIGAEKAKGDYMVLLSNDIRVSRDWLKNAIATMESDKRIGVAQSILYMADFPSQLDRTGNYVDALGFNHPFSLTGRDIEEVFYSEGAVMFIRRKLVDEALGLFDETYFMLYEDVDFCWRARLMGYKVVVMQTSKAYHKCGGTVPGTLMKTDPQYVFTNTRNRLNTLLKNYSAGNAIEFVPFSTMIEITKGIWLMFNGKKRQSLACFSGILSFLSGIPVTMKKRACVQEKRTLRNDKEITRFMTPLREAIGNVIGSVHALHNDWRKRQDENVDNSVLAHS